MSGLDPVTLQVMTGALRAACDEMGAVLIRSAHSPNINERHDCSTALFDAAGELVMQAEHIPVHLGSMPDAVAAIVGEEHRDGDLWILNDPYRGGTHLPDITLICSASFAMAERAARVRREPRPPRRHRRPDPGRHAGPLGDARRGGRRDPADPGRRRRAARARRSQMRNPEQRLADLRAQRAANLTGIRRLRQLAERHGLELLRDRDGGDPRLRRAAHPGGALGDARRREHRRGRARGPRRRHPAAGAGERSTATRSSSTSTAAPSRSTGNLNCPLSVTKAACFYAVRVVCDPDAPPSAGAWRPVTVTRARGIAAQRAAAGGRGRRQRRDLEPGRRPGLRTPWPAFAPVRRRGPGHDEQPDARGGEDWTYYETIGGGQGACPDADGPSAEHVAMSNTLNTPIEALETEYPLLRPGALGAPRQRRGGRHRGGDGIVRELEALEPMRFTLIGERRRHARRAATGGEPGAPGRDLLNGEPIPAKTEGRALRRATGCGSRRPGAAGTAPNRSS